MPSQATRPPLAGMPAVWLRDNCPCPLCRDPVSGQRLLHITDIPADIAVAEVVPSAGTVSVLFHPDGHRAVFDRDWLARHAEPGRGGPPDPRTEDAKRLWSAADLGGEPPRGSWPRYLARPATGGPASPPSCGKDCSCSATCPRTRARSWRWPRAWATSGRPTTAGCSTSGPRARRPTWPSPACLSPRTPTTRTATRCRPSNCCTACTMRPRAATPGSWTASTPPPRSARRIPPRSPRSPSPRSPSATVTPPRSCPPPGR